MTTMVARTLAITLLTFAIPLFFGEAFAQESQQPEEVAEQVSEEQVSMVPVEPWYELERISGNIEVGDFVVGPGRAEISARPGETVVTEIIVTNRISGDREFILELENIQGTRDGKSLVAVPEDVEIPFGVADFISFPENSFDLDLGERARIPVRITVPENVTPGGYYGAVMVSTVRKPADDIDAPAVPRSPIITRISSLIFLTVEGDLDISGELVSFDTLNNSRPWYESGPIDFGILYENTGTVHLNPYGEVSVKNMLGDEVGYLELEPWFVLPQSLRLREFSWDREFLFGRYTVDIELNRGYEDVIDSKQISFWVLPWKLVGSIFLVLFIVIFTVRAFFRTFEFKRKPS